jgi:hypothetical protein
MLKSLLAEHEGEHASLHHVVYASFLKEKDHRRQLAATTDPFLLKKRLEVWYDLESRQRRLSIATQAFRELGHCSLPEETTRFHFASNDKVWGEDVHGHGWNLLGRAASSIHNYNSAHDSRTKEIQLLHPLVHKLTTYLHQGDSLRRFYSLTVAEMMETLDLTSSVKEPSEEVKRLIRDEVAYPGCLVHLLRRYHAPAINGTFQEQVDGKLVEGASLLLSEYGQSSSTQEDPATPTLLQNLRYLYQHKKLPLPTRLLECIERIESRFWTDAEVREALAFVPRNLRERKDVFIKEGDKCHPLTPQTELVQDGFSFLHVFEYIYYGLLRDILLHETPSVCWARVRAIQDWSSTKEAEKMLGKARVEWMEHLLRQQLDVCCRKKPLMGWALLTEPITFTDPYDPCFSDILVKLLKEKRAAVEIKMKPLCRWVRPRTCITFRDFRRYYAVMRSQQLWKRLDSCAEIFFRTFYPKARTLHQAFRSSRVQSPETVLGRMQVEWKGKLLEKLKKDKAHRHVARILHHVCFPDDVFCPQPRQLVLDNSEDVDPFFVDVARLL